MQHVSHSLCGIIIAVFLSNVLDGRERPQPKGLQQRNKMEVTAYTFIIIFILSSVMMIKRLCQPDHVEQIKVAPTEIVEEKKEEVKVEQPEIVEEQKVRTKVIGITITKVKKVMAQSGETLGVWRLKKMKEKTNFYGKHFGQLNWRIPRKLKKRMKKLLGGGRRSKDIVIKCRKSQRNNYLFLVTHLRQ